MTRCPFASRARGWMCALALAALPGTLAAQSAPLDRRVTLQFREGVAAGPVGARDVRLVHGFDGARRLVA